LMVEVHPSPSEALSDGQQSLTPENFRLLVAGVRDLSRAIGRRLADAAAPCPTRSSGYPDMAPPPAQA